MRSGRRQEILETVTTVTLLNKYGFADLPADPLRRFVTRPSLKFCYEAASDHIPRNVLCCAQLNT
jgi:hypothetical protein